MERRALIVRGIVQGVGFRPHVYRLARRCQLNGSVRNESGSVRIEVEGDAPSLDRFCQELADGAPALAVIAEISCKVVGCRGDSEFRIEDSAAGRSSEVLISPDVATCPDCLLELFDPADRRYRYPFLNCTNCGPRLTIVYGAPYDRHRTTMASFRMCAACRAEYENPSDRRYHAQPTCCPRCGPRLKLFTSRRDPIAARDPVTAFARLLRKGQVGALKGLGGYHLVCDASSTTAVHRLRKRKARDDKPFAIMVVDMTQALRLCEVGTDERDLLLSNARPIVLLRRRQDRETNIAEAVAPGNPYLGLLLPYTPLHHLLMGAMGGRPLVVTSGNRSDEPIAYADDTAFEQLGDIVDAFLIHDRPIHVRCDDSVTRVLDKAESPVRRSRGYAPRPMALPIPCACPILAAGGQLKSTFALGHNRTALLSHHLGDLDDYQAFRAFQRDIALYEQLFDIRPELIVHDLHPDYASARYASQRAADQGISTLTVQHHHAHVASCMAEHGLQGDVIGVAFDGTGMGTDGTIWGGEFLVAGYGQFRRDAHLRYVPLPGGDHAAREPWRSAVAHALDAGCDLSRIASISSRPELPTILQMIARRVNSPLASSAGRLFDAVAALLGVRARVSFEGQAAMELEWLATGQIPDGSYSLGFDRTSSGSLLEIDTRQLVRDVADDMRRGTDRRRVARRFHSTMVKLIAAVCVQIREESGLDRVVLSGGVFSNVLLTRETVACLTDDGFCVYRHQLVPPNDGGLSLGQLAVAAALTGRQSAFGSRRDQTESSANVTARGK